MKKIIAVLLSLALLLSCAAVFAETAEEKEEFGMVNVNGAFILKGKLPDGYRLMIMSQDATKLIGLLHSDDPIKPRVTISIAFNEEYADVERMNDLEESVVDEIKASFSDEDEVKFEDRETAYGTRVLITTETGEDNIDFADFYSIYKGYEIEFVLTPGSDGTITEEQIQMLIDFASDLDFVAAE